MTAVTVVCTGNVCRSPLAERLLALRAPGIEVGSAGTHARNGMAMHPESARVLRALGGDPSGLASRLLTPAVLPGDDLVLGLTRAHRDAVVELAPRLWKRTFTLLEAAALASGGTTIEGLARARLAPGAPAPDDPALDIADPIGGPPELHDRVGAEISAAVDAVLGLVGRPLNS